MSRKVTALAVAIAAMTALFASAIVYADSPSVSITSIGGVAPGGTVYVSSLPTTLTVAGTVSHGIGINSVSGVELKVDATVCGTLNNFPSIPGNPSTSNFALPCLITAAGLQTFTVGMRHGDDWGYDSEVVTVEVSSSIVCKAAPAIAADWLRTNHPGVKSGSKLYKNIISHIANEMTQGAQFQSHDKCTTGYVTAVQVRTTYLVEQLVQ
jgi:hypothetical protein